MKSTAAIIAALASTRAVAQPHGHAHAHQHPARMEHQHAHLHGKRLLETETVVEWFTETVIEMIDATTTQWITHNPTPTTFATLTTSTTEPGEFFEGASTAAPSSVVPSVPSVPSVALPVETPSSSPAYVAPAPAPTTSSSSVYVPAPAPEPTTSSTTSEPPVVVAPTSTSTTEAAAAVPTPAAVPTESTTTSSSSSDSGATTGWKITWIGDTTGALTACGQPYEADSMYVAVDPTVLDCGSDGKGTPMTVTANGKTVSAYAIDKCMGCDPTHIDVATAVYEALGYTLDDGGMHNTGKIDWVIS